MGPTGFEPVGKMPINRVNKGFCKVLGKFLGKFLKIIFFFANEKSPHSEALPVKGEYNDMT